MFEFMTFGLKIVPDIITKGGIQNSLTSCKQIKTSCR